MALVFGKVFGYYDLHKTTCWASAHRIASELSMSRSTVQRCLTKLEHDGVIVDVAKVPGKVKEYVIADMAAWIDRFVWDMHKEAGLGYIGECQGRFYPSLTETGPVSHRDR